MLFKDPSSSLSRVESTVKVHRHGVPILLRREVHSIDLDAHTGIRNDNIESAIITRDRLHDRLNGRNIGDIGLVGLHVAARTVIGDLSCCFLGTGSR